MPHGPESIQRTMVFEVLHDLIYQICEVYLDDIIIYASTEQEFLERLNTVLARLTSISV